MRYLAPFSLSFLISTQIFGATIFEGTLTEQPGFSLVTSHENGRILEGSFSTHPYHFPESGDFFISGGDITLFKAETNAQDFKFIFSKKEPDLLIGYEILLTGSGEDFVDFLVELNRALGKQAQNYRVDDTNRLVNVSVTLEKPLKLKEATDDTILKAEEILLTVSYDRDKRSATAVTIFGLPKEKKRFKLTFKLF